MIETYGLHVAEKQKWTKKLPEIEGYFILKRRNYRWVKIDEYIEKRSAQDADFAKQVEQEDINLEVAIKVRSLREDMGLTQREFAQVIGKPQSTVARIENGNMNASTKMLSDIAKATKQRLTIQFEPVH